MKHFWLIILLLFAACSEQIAGSKGGSETTNGIMASVRHADGTPAVGSIVRLRSADYVSNPATFAKRVVSSKDVITDPYGQFMITRLEPGSYSLEVLDISADYERSGAALFTFTIGADDTLDLGVDSLRPFATLSGTVDTAGIKGRRLFAQVKGLERLVQVDTNGVFTFDDLPEGYFDVIIIDADTANYAKEVLNVKMTSEETVTVNFPNSVSYSRYIYFNAGSTLSSSVKSFPLLVRLDSATFDFSQADPQGNDVRFVKMDGSALPFEIEQWDPVAGNASVWVRIDTVYSGSADQSIIMKWGSSSASRISSGSAVFDTALGFAGVWHLNENPASGAGAIKDRTVNRFNGTASSSMTAENVKPAMIGNGLWFNGVSDSIEAGALNVTGSYTLSCWVNMEQWWSTNLRFILKEGSYTLWYDRDWGGLRVEHFIPPYGYWVGIYQNVPDSVPVQLNTGTWYHFAGTFDGDKIRMFVNGQQVDSTETLEGMPSSNTEQLLFGGRVNEFFKGTLDEVRIEKQARSAEWIKLCYESQKRGSVVVKFRGRSF